MRAVIANGVTLHVQEAGDPNGQPVLFSNSLGTDLRLWDEILPLLPDGLRILRYDTRGHGLSECPGGPYSMDALSRDAIALIEAMKLGPVIFVGLSIGGMIGQQLAARRPDLVIALVLSNTAVKMGDPQAWQDRIAAIQADGLAALESAVLDRWFGPDFRTSTNLPLWGAMLARTPQAGYTACCAAIAGCDLTETTRVLRLPVLVIAGSDDGASPPDLVAATAALIPKADFHVIDRTGHLPCVENSAAYAAILNPFLKEYAHG
ncbi:3-oxoadipate enol-lactonase [Sulfitobacter sp. M57]|uniref:3-oxoadipate enol-lactonase n=1 Tax=unclassified Sulfitobacter TaxID=196795 RepID=UPI0023E228C7|nr:MULTISPECIES: 3-oxoadipate enol-lactonase [unclassified Sulfitobacter]MDF3416112.1 3-oxoadipate enol-lactonase [Sulfitobacter sp. KE5]MDF3423591.1 3-oxoadipate enol-lactonase [Sulfitobacter sp. KE43]MDF3434607.1 3-oxoadipate enol-lactonase [Sulfitobacter sp. KE42]MDF3460297.1 3-oxoadipate enol-lactonase [Sulfitobacter sp. S74]MDF3464145.1 3-oxoadipate enol-lactonase [Sulfitobacter sp. Ks18]